jgi:glyoxylase-like metal-dependent hydrolase (beta-lactamase superfamily II)
MLLGLLFVASSVAAEDEKNVFHFRMGTWEVTMLSEGQQMGRASILVGASEEALRVIPEGVFPNAINAFLVRRGEQVLLIDTGLGSALFGHLKALGVEPEDVDVVLLTHMHGDHVGGMLRNGARTFPRAEVWVARQERDFWAEREGLAKRVLEAYGKQLRLFEPVEGKDVAVTGLPGVKGIAAFGHTPGHCAFLLEDGEERLLVWGDLTHAMAVQMPFPQVAVTYDVDAGRAVESRLAILARVVREGIPVAGMHVPFPGIGWVVEEDEGYRFVPAH